MQLGSDRSGEGASSVQRGSVEHQQQHEQQQQCRCEAVHNVACAPFQAITFGDALLLCSSSLHPMWHLITFKSMHRAHQLLKLRHARDLSPCYCALRSLTLFDPAKFLVDSLNFSKVMFPFVKLCDAFARRTC